MARAEAGSEMMQEQPRWSALPTAVLSGAMIGAAGLMAVLPNLYPASGVTIVAMLILAAGVIDITTAMFFAPKWARLLVLWAGIAAVAASSMLLLSEEPRFLFAAAVVTGWLFVKATTLVLAAVRSPSMVGKDWLRFSALINALLAFLAIGIVSSVALAILLFGPTPELARFSLIPALSMLITGASGLAAAIRAARHHQESSNEMTA
jgi:uncharacterized membrane protein HdeD (DUF308 family)